MNTNVVANGVNNHKAQRQLEKREKKQGNRYERQLRESRKRRGL